MMLATLLIAGVVFGLMGVVIVKKIKAHKNGESTCGCGCSGCSSVNKCHSKG